jgi:hypothetical protein
MARMKPSSLVFRAMWQLVRFDCGLRFHKFSDVYAKVRNHRIATRDICSPNADTICAAVNLACIWYPHHVLCLQKSLSTTCLLRDFGIPAFMVIGAQCLPFQAHAWVELEGRVVNDLPYIGEMYAVLDRF